MKRFILSVSLIILAFCGGFYAGTQNPSFFQYSDAVRSSPISSSSILTSISATKKPVAKATAKPTAKPTKKPSTVTKAPQVTYVLNKKTKKFHKPSCSSVDQMNESNKIYSTAPRSSIISDGYSPCGRCHP